MENEILQAGKDFDKIGDLIQKFAKKCLKPTNEEIIFIKSFLYHDDYYVRESSAYALFFIWQLNDNDLIHEGLSIIENENEDFDVKRWIISGLSFIYRKNNEDKILNDVFKLFLSEKDTDTKSILLDSILYMHGLSSCEILINKINFDILNSSDETRIKLKLFMNEIEKILKL